jgi:predicted membrane-bound spermidine synthase
MHANQNSGSQEFLHPTFERAAMREIWLIFLSIFAAGVVSLLLELSLLREFTYIFGSTAVSNALIISIFLVGLAGGAYLGTWGAFSVKDETDARRKFALIQLFNIIFIVLFCLSKKFFVYECRYANLVQLYFIVSVLAPSVLAGMGYAISVKIMHWRGEKFITYIYAFSTLGSVVGGLAHGIILVPLWGMRSTYISAIIFAGIALYLMYSLMSVIYKSGLVLLVVGSVALIHFNISEFLFPSKNILFSKDSEFGIVEVWKLNNETASYLNRQIGGEDADLRMNEAAIDLKVNNIHQSFNFPIDRSIHKQWAATSLQIVNRPATVLMFGYGSGVSAASYLESPLVKKMDIIENCDPVIEAASVFFPEEFRLVTRDKRANFVVDDFRGYVRFTEKKYDIIALDHSLQDPYSIGYFTVEFFEQVKNVMNPGGVVLLLGNGLSWNTTRMSFKYVYNNISPQTEHALRLNLFYLSDEKFTGPATHDYQLVKYELMPEGLVFSDERVVRLNLAKYAESRARVSP